VRNQPASGIGNFRMQIHLETPGFAIDLDGKEIAKRVAEMIRTELSELYSKGLDARGRALPGLSQATVARRRRRREQRRDDTGAKRARFKTRGRAGQGARSFLPRDDTTPFHESGLMADGVDVRFKGTESGDPVFLVAFPSGGKKRGLVSDDGRGARLFAVEHYGFERMADVPPKAEPKIDKMLELHLEDLINGGTSVIAQFGEIVRTLDDFVEET